MKEIKLTQGKVTMVDDEDYEYLSKNKWQAGQKGSSFYATRRIKLTNGKSKTIYMHREIMRPPQGMQIDHADGDPLNNRRNNLRICTQTQNNGNSKTRRDNTSGLKGVYWHKTGKKWGAQLHFQKKHIHVGLFTNKDVAALAYDKAAKEYFGEFARLNYG